MELSARVSLFLSYASRIFLFTIGVVLLFLFTPLRAHAQTDQLSPYSQNLDANVKLDQHILAQTVTIDLMSALICQLAGVDVIHPSQGCVGINPATNKLSYAPVKGHQVGGLLGVGTTMISSLYIPPASGVSYARNLASNFGIVKHSYAQIGPDCGDTKCSGVDNNRTTGFDALQPVQKLWLAVRNLTFVLFILVFVILGIAIMLRYKIDGHGHGQTVMSLQNQLPKIVVTLILISFSYAIVGLVIDFMWVTTYFGINVLTSADNPVVTTCGDTDPDSMAAEVNGITVDSGPRTLKERAFSNIVNIPFSYVNDIFHQSHCDEAYVTQIFVNGLPGADRISSIFNSGMANLSYQVGTAMGSLVSDVVNAVIPLDDADCGLRHFSGCVEYAVGKVINIIVSIIGFLIAVVAVFIAMFRLWWSLLKSYAYVIVFTIIAPLFILLGLIPGSHNGFSSWLRKIVANLAVFPAAALLIVTARIIMDLYQSGASNNFVTPLIGNPTVGVMGPLIAFGLLMLGPELTNLVKGALGAPSGQIGGIVQAGLMAGVGPGTFPIRQPFNRIMARGGHGENAGFLRNALVGTGSSNQIRPHQRLIRSLGIARGFPDTYHPVDQRTVGGGGN